MSRKERRNKRKEEEKLPQFHIRIVRDEYERVTRVADPEDEWGADDTDTDHTIYGYEVTEGYWDFVLHEHPNKRPLYLIYALYDTGDSFHRADNKICLIFLSLHKEDAIAVERALEENSRTKSDDFHAIEVKLPIAKETVTIGTSTWKGYFESLRSFNFLSLCETTNR